MECNYNFPPKSVFLTAKLNFWCYDLEFTLPLLKKHYFTPKFYFYFSDKLCENASDIQNEQS